MDAFSSPSTGGSEQGNGLSGETEDEDLVVLQPQDVAEVVNVDASGVPPEEDEEIGAETVRGEVNVPSRIDDAVYILDEHSGSVFVVASSSHGRNLLASGSSDDTGMIWDLDAKKRLARIGDVGESVVHVEFSYDGKYCAFGAMNGAVIIASLDGGDLVSRFTLDEQEGDAVEFLAWHPRGPVMLVGGADAICRMWNVATHKPMVCFTGHGKAVTCGEFTSDGKLVVTASADGSIKVWSPKDGKCLMTIANGVGSVGREFHSSEEGIICMALGKGEKMRKLALTGGLDGTVRISHIETGRIIGCLPSHDGSVETVAFSNPQFFPCLAASGGTDGKIQVWDVELNALRSTMTHEAAVTKIRWHPTDHQIISSSIDGTVRIWDARTGSEVKCYQGHTDGVLDVCVISGLSAVASASDDKTIRLYDSG